MPPRPFVDLTERHGDEVGGNDGCQRPWAASISLNATARPAALEPGPLVTLVRSRSGERRLNRASTSGTFRLECRRMSDGATDWRESDCRDQPSRKFLVRNELGEGVREKSTTCIR